MKASDSIRTIKGIGEKSGKLFGKLGITTVEELLAFYPREYDLFTAIQPVSSVREGETVIFPTHIPLMPASPLLLPHDWSVPPSKNTPGLAFLSGLHILPLSESLAVIGEKSEELFKKLGITTVEELLAFWII